VSGDSCDGRISVLNHSLSWSKFVNTHLYHSRQWFNIHILALQNRRSCRAIEVCHAKHSLCYALRMSDVTKSLWPILDCRLGVLPYSKCAIWVGYLTYYTYMGMGCLLFFDLRVVRCRQSYKSCVSAVIFMLNRRRWVLRHTSGWCNRCTRMLGTSMSSAAVVICWRCTCWHHRRRQHHPPMM